MSDWLFNPAYQAQYDLPPTQQREVVKRLAKKNIVDPTAASDEIQAVLRAVHTAYGNKKERARAASAKSRATKKDDVSCSTGGDTLAQDAVVACVAQAHVSVCDVAVDCVAEAVPEAAAPEAVAAPTPAVLCKREKKNTRADNVAVEPAPVAAVPAVAPTPKRVVEAAPRRGLCAMVASASI